ncbi:MAG TPA: hypothetical protein VFW24_10435, partial [Acidimicrobiales bacterium]|nr:hypothetical protein [Acidimicrobiales bacterium]
LRLSDGTFTGSVNVGFTPSDVAVTPDGTTAWVVGQTKIVPVALPGLTLGTTITVAGASLAGIALTPNACWGYVTNANGPSVVPVNLTTGATGAAITTDASPSGVAVAYTPRTYYYEVEGTRNLWTSPASSQQSVSFGQPSRDY